MISRILERLTRQPAKFVIYALVLGVFFGGAGTALAGTASSPYYYYGPVLGYNYDNQATVVAETSPLVGAWAATWVGQDGYLSVPPGYMGAKARLYDSSGILREASNWVYNNSSANAFDVLTPTDSTPGTYYSYGISAAYNGNGYYTYYTYVSPYQSY